MKARFCWPWQVWCDLSDAPFFTKSLQDLRIPASETVTLECTTSLPTVTPTWLKNGVVLTPDSLHDISSEGTIHRLVVKDAAAEDTAEYTCQINGDATSAILDVTGITHMHL